MLDDEKAIEIISKAQQKNVRDPKRKREPFNCILEDFFVPENFNNQSVLDLGPGQFDFGVLAKEVSTNCKLMGIDKDPAVIELGEYLGIKCIEQDFEKFDIEDKTLRNLQVDGIFCKFSFNAFWNLSADLEEDMLESKFLKLMRPDAWGWLAPWNGLSGHDVPSLERNDELLTFQKNVFRRANFKCFNLDKHFSIKYGIHGVVENNPVFTRNLRTPAHLEEFREF